MSETTFHADLTPVEWALVKAIRELPDPGLQARAHEVFRELLFYVGNPRCEGMGVEGFPCGEPAASCDECQDVWTTLEGLLARATRP